MAIKKPICAKCEKEIEGKAIAMQDVTDKAGDEMCPECFVGFCKYMVERGGRVPIFGDMPLEEQRRIVNDPQFLQDMRDMSEFEPGDEMLDARFVKQERLH